MSIVFLKLIHAFYVKYLILLKAWLQQGLPLPIEHDHWSYCWRKTSYCFWNNCKSNCSTNLMNCIYDSRCGTSNVTFANLTGHEFVVYKHIGIWRDIIQKHISALFIFQDNIKAISELITNSNFPIFKTNLTNKLDAYKKLQDHKPKLIPIINPEAKVHIYANYRINNKDKLSNLIILSKKLMR